MTPFHSYSDEEESLMNRDGRDAKSERRSSSSSSFVIRAAVFCACVMLGSLAFVASSSSSSSSSRAPLMMLRKMGDATSGEEAYLGTLPKRTWGSNGAS